MPFRGCENCPFPNSRYQAERLLRTEIARAQIQAQTKKYNSLDTRYR